MTRVAIVEDHPLFHAALTAMLAKQGFEVVFVATTVAEARTLLGEHVVDVVLLDLGLPDGSGLELVRERLGCDVHREGGPRYVVLSSFDDGRSMASVERSGCEGFVSKLAEPSAIAACVRAVARGERVFDWRPGQVTSDGVAAVLTERESACLALTAEGMTNAEIASVLGVSSETVKTHMAAIRAKLGANDRAHAVAIAVRRGLL